MSILQLIDPPATINPGDPLTVRFHAGADAGIIQSEVQVASEHVTVMNRWPERDGPVPSTYRTALVPVTNDHPLGSQIRIRVVVTTRFGLQGASDWLLGPTVVDIAHPQIYSYCLTAGIGDRCNIYPATLPFQTGDTLRINLTARDNYGLEHLVWRVDGFATDSVEIREDEETEITIPVQSGWTDARSITFYVVDKAGLRSPMISHAIRSVPRL